MRDNSKNNKKSGGYGKSFNKSDRFSSYGKSKDFSSSKSAYRPKASKDRFGSKSKGHSSYAPEAVEKTFEADNGAVPGRNAVRELLKSGRAIEKVYVRQGDREGSITVLVSEILNRGIPLIETDRKKLDELCDYEQHQGIVAIAAEKEYVEIEDLLNIAKEKGEKPLIVIADGITDPHNLGAIIRCAEGAGAHGIIIPKRRAACLTPAVTKASAGALEHLAVVKCSNVADTVRKLKDEGLWIFAAEADGTSYLDADFDVACAIVLGSEENGVSEVVKKNCDYTVSIPMLGKVNSLNVSTAAAVLLYEAIRKRSINS